MSVDQNIDGFTTTPLRTNPATFSADTDTYHTELATFVDQITTWTDQVNDTAVQISADARSAESANSEAVQSALIAQGSANYQGDWVVGSYSIGQSVTYDGTDYISKIDNNTDEPPSVNWKISDLNGAISQINRALFSWQALNNATPEKSANPNTDAVEARASSKQHVDRLGRLQTYGNDVLARNEKGTNSEGVGENLFLHAKDYSSAEWLKQDLTVDSNVTTAPDGTMTADRINTTSNGNVRQIVAILAGDDLSGSFYVKKDTSDIIDLAINGVSFGFRVLQYTFSTDSFGNSSFVEGESEILNDGWVRLNISATSALFTENTDIRVYPNKINGVDAQSMFIWTGQAEKLPFATSPIDTTTISVTREKDIITINPSENMPNINKDWTISYRLFLPSVKAIGIDRDFLKINNASGVIFRARQLSVTDNRVAINYGGTAYTDMQGLLNENDFTKIHHVKKDNTLYLYIDGILIDSDTVSDIADNQITSITLGDNLYGSISEYEAREEGLTATAIALESK